MTLQVYEIYSIFIDKGGGGVGENTCHVHVRASKWQNQDSHQDCLTPQMPQVFPDTTLPFMK